MPSGLTPSTLVWLFGERYVKEPSRFVKLAKVVDLVQSGHPSMLPSTTLPSGAKADGDGLAGVMLNRAAWSLRELGLLELAVKTPSDPGQPLGDGGGEVSFKVLGDSADETIEGKLLRHLAKAKPEGRLTKAAKRAADHIPMGVEDVLAPGHSEWPEFDQFGLQDRLEKGPHWRDWIKLARKEAEAAGCVQMAGLPSRRKPQLNRSKLAALERAHSGMDARYEQFKAQEPDLAAAILDACAVGVTAASAAREEAKSTQ